MVRKGDKQAVVLFEKFNKVPMPDHTDLTEDNIKNIVAYIKSESGKSEKKSSSIATSASKSKNRPISLAKDFWPLMGLAAAIGLLISTLLFTVRVKK